MAREREVLVIMMGVWQAYCHEGNHDPSNDTAMDVSRKGGDAMRLLPWELAHFSASGSKLIRDITPEEYEDLKRVFIETQSQYMFKNRKYLKPGEVKQIMTQHGRG